MKLTTILVLTTCILGGGLRHAMASPVPAPIDPESSASHPARLSSPEVAHDPSSSTSQPPKFFPPNPNSEFAKLSTAELKELYEQATSGFGTSGRLEKLTPEEIQEVRNLLIIADAYAKGD